MGLLPIEFYSISPIEFHLMVEGYRNRRKDEYKLNRNILFVMQKLWSSKPVNDPNQLWQLDETEETSEDEIDKLFDELRKKQNV
jgi:hypothetical protein